MRLSGCRSKPKAPAVIHSSCPLVMYAQVSVAGVGVSAMQMGDNAGQSLQNLVINIALGAAVFAAFNFDTTVVQKEIKNKTRKDLENPYLKGGTP